MAFTLKVEIDDATEKRLSIASRLATFNDQPVPSAQEWLMAAVDARIEEAVGKVVETNKLNREQAIAAADDSKLAQIDALLGISKVEDSAAVADLEKRP